MEKLGIIGGATLVFMVADIVTGYIAAWMSKTVSSQKMREGLGHKYTILVLMALGALFDYLQYKDIINFGGYISFFIITCIYVMFMELNSILENIILINPDLKDSGLFRFYRNNAQFLNQLADSMISRDQDKIGKDDGHEL